MRRNTNLRNLPTRLTCLTSLTRPISPTCLLIVALSAALGSHAVEPTTVFTVRIGDYGDQGMALTVDAQGNSYVAGSRYSSSNPFPISNNAAQTRPAAMFIAKVDARGERIV